MEIDCRNSMTPPAVRLPNFFLAGVPRAGTTSFYAYLGQHPEIYVSPIKEPAFFGAADLLSGRYGAEISQRSVRDRDALRPYLEGTPPPGPQPLVLEWESYLDLFRNVRNETAVGEGTVSYFWLPNAAGAIQRMVPEPRLIFILRDPAERLFSHHLASLWHDPHRTFRQRFFNHSDSHGGAAPPGMVNEGRFATHLQRFFALFPRNHIRIYLYEDYRAAPRAVLRDAFAFLGVDRDHPVDLSRRHNETLSPRLPLLHRLRHRVFGSGPVRWIPERARRAMRWAYARAGANVAMDPADRRLAIDYYRDEIQRTADLIGRDLSAWLR
jgi:sulfotransferase family protein